MAALTAFLPYVLPYVIGCAQPTAEQFIRSACIEFCARTLMIQDVATQSITAGVSEYDIDTPTSSVLNKVLAVMVKDSWITPVSTESVRSGLALRGAVGALTPASGEPSCYFQKTPTSSAITLYPVPDYTLANGLVIRTAFCPSRASTTVDDQLFEDWAEVISSLAIARMLMVPGQSFSNASLAAPHLINYHSGAAAAANLARSGQAAAASRVQPVRF